MPHFDIYAFSYLHIRMLLPAQNVNGMCHVLLDETIVVPGRNGGAKRRNMG
jgi:hypothetical protein